MLTPKKQVTILFSVATNMTLLKRLQEEARKQARWLHALIELKDVENSLDGITANTVTAVLDEVEREVKPKTKNNVKHFRGNGYFNQQGYNQCVDDIKAIIQSKRTEI